MAYDFPKAHDAHIQLLYDRHDSLYHSSTQLTEQITAKAEEDANSLLDAVINNRPNSHSSALEILKHQYNGLRVQTLLGLTNPQGIFKATVPHDAQLLTELVNDGEWIVTVHEDQKTMEVSTVPF